MIQNIASDFGWIVNLGRTRSFDESSISFPAEVLCNKIWPKNLILILYLIKLVNYYKIYQQIDSLLLVKVNYQKHKFIWIV